MRLTGMRTKITVAVCGALCCAEAAEITVEQPGACTRKTGFVISEIMYKPDDAATLNTEFVEIYNSNPFEEELGGYRLSGEIDYTFPDGTMLAGQSYLVLAKNKANFLQRYTNSLPAEVQVFEYGNPDASNSLGRSGTLRMINSCGGVILEIHYDHDDPWPVAADGTGHSLVLARPSYGEDDPQAWSMSDSVGGSPGTGDAYGDESLRHVSINELLAHTDDPQLDTIELYNHSNSNVDLSGCILSDDPALAKFMMPTGTVIAARGFVIFDQNQLGFSLNAGGEAVYFWNAQTNRVIDAVQFGGQENGVSIGRFPDGGAEFYRMGSLTPGSSNAARRIDPVVINEIMYDPISGDKDDEFVELYNQGSNTIDLSGWQLDGGIKYTFPDGAGIPAGGYLVIAHDAVRLQTNYAQLNSTNTFGNFSGGLANGGERVLLTKPDTVVDLTITNAPVTNLIHIAVDDFTYATGGQWPVWAHGGGSSMERINPRANPRFATAWADSDESTKAPWTPVSVTGRLELGSGSADAIEGGLQGAGECLLDNVEVLYGGNNCVSNSTFESGLSNWVARGDHARSALDTNSYEGAYGLRVRASDRFDTGANRILGTLTTTLASGSNATINAQARWLKGNPWLTLRIHGNYLEAQVRLDTPSNLGTPGLVNSCAVTNAVPDIAGVKHAPAVPAANEDVVVSAQVEDSDGLMSVTLNYRIDPSTTYTNVPMNDNGTLGDAVAGDSIYSATIPGQPSGTLVAFRIEAVDAAGSSMRVFPGNTPDNYPRPRECLVRFGDATRASSFGSYRMWFTDAATSNWEHRLMLSNEPIEGTFVYNDERIIYNFSAHYSGSVYHQIWLSPTNDCHYSMAMPLDDQLLGTDNFNKLHAPGNDPFEDHTFQREQLVYWMARKLHLPWLYRRYVNVYVNGVARKEDWLMEDTQVPTGDFLEEYWPGDATGNLYKLSPWWEIEDAALGALTVGKKASWAQLLPYRNAEGQLHAPRYRWSWAARSYDGAGANNDPVLDLVDTANAESSLTEGLSAVADMENWMRTLAVRHIVGDWDCFGTGGTGQNMYAYKPVNGRWLLISWDSNISIGNSDSYPPGRALFPDHDDFCSDATMTTIYNNPTFRRIYLRALKELCNGPLQADKYNAVLDAKYSAFTNDGLSAAYSPDVSFSYNESRADDYDGEGPGSFSGSVRDWLNDARTNVLARIALQDATNFALSSPDNITNANNLITISGTAPVEVASIMVNGVEYPITWISVTNWSIDVVLDGGSSTLEIQGVDVCGNPINGFSNSVATTVSGPVDSPEDSVVINEILYNPAVSGAEFVELHNRSATTAFNLANWRFNGLDHTFVSTVLAPGGYLVLAKDKTVFDAQYGFYPDVEFDGNLDPGGETLTLFRPVGTNGTEAVVDRVHYESVAPWPAPPADTSLQLKDAAQDNRRAALWGVSSGTTPNQTIIDWGDIWKYAPTNNLDGIAWTTTIYDDSAWSSGQGALGVESSTLPHPIQTTQTLGFVTYYYRKTIDFTGQPSGTFWLNSMIDDGAVFYLDGEEMQRLRMPAGTITSSTPASSSIDNATEEGPFGIAMSLSTGTHVFAVEVHQSGAGSSDLVFDMNVEGSYTPATPGTANNVGYTNAAIPDLWLNEVLPLPDSGPPWVELYNAGEANIALSGYLLSNDYNDLAKWAITNATTISTGQFLQIYLPSGSLTNAGSIMLSRNVGGGPELIDYLNYTNLPGGWSYGDFPEGQPCYRIDMYADTPGAANTNQAPPIDVRINEWMADNLATIADNGSYDDWFELYNPGTSTVDAGGCFLTDDLSDPFQFEIPSDGTYVIPAHGFLLVWADNEPAQNSTNTAALHVDFKLSKFGESIAVVASDGTVVDSVAFGAQTTDVSEGRFTDGESIIVPLQPATPGASNQVANNAPQLDPINDFYVYPGETVIFTAHAMDAQSASQILTFSLDAGAPAGASITTNGIFSWTVPSNMPPGTVSATIRVADNGLPVMEDSDTFSMDVYAPPVVDSLSSASNQLFGVGVDTLPGHVYQLKYKDVLTNAVWLPLEPAVTGMSDRVEWGYPTTNVPVRFYRMFIDQL